METRREIFDDLAAHSEKMFRAGVPAEEAADRYVVPERLKDCPVIAWSFRIEATVAKVYAGYGAGKAGT